MVTDETKTCPSCGSDWVDWAHPIPEKSRENYGGKTHFMRQIGIYDIDRDRTRAYQCPDCKEEFPRG